MSDGLFWKTKSGRQVQTNSTVYEVYTPQCRNSELNRDTANVRCWETLRYSILFYCLHYWLWSFASIRRTFLKDKVRWTPTSQQHCILDVARMTSETGTYTALDVVKT
uniref:Uncharacterized protein n=1 Tax=Magallana gigas TaxID=29159 RepID=A0A8W8LIY8_MAGGI